MQFCCSVLVYGCTCHLMSQLHVATVFVHTNTREWHIHQWDAAVHFSDINLGNQSAAKYVSGPISAYNK